MARNQFPMGLAVVIFAFALAEGGIVADWNDLITGLTAGMTVDNTYDSGCIHGHDAIYSNAWDLLEALIRIPSDPENLFLAIHYLNQASQTWVAQLDRCQIYNMITGITGLFSLDALQDIVIAWIASPTIYNAAAALLLQGLTERNFLFVGQALGNLIRYWTSVTIT
jgi:hypothetical protein